LRIGGKHLIHDLFDFPAVGNLFQALLFDDLVGAALARAHCFKNCLRQLGGKRVVENTRQQASELTG